MSGNPLDFTVFHLFSGLGGGALGFQRAAETWNGQTVRFTTLGGIDSDPEACADFTALTGTAVTCLDLFARDDYTAFHGHEPGPDWREATPEDLRHAAGGKRPDVVFTSPPCKAFSGLLPAKQATSPKYEALSRLTVRGIALTLAAWGDDLPGLILLENVPRITSRGKDLLTAIKALLTSAGYVFDERTHDLGEVGGLAQHRRRYLLVARHPAKVPAMLYHVPVRKVRSIGSALESLPLPDARESGALHRLPRLQWRTWVRLALIPAGGDWRDLQGIHPGQYAIEADRACYSNIYRVTKWAESLPTVTSGKDAAIADPRLDHRPRKGVYQVAEWDEPVGTIIGNARVGGSNGVAAIADPRLKDRESRHPGTYKIQVWDEAADTVTGSRFGSGALAVADPRISSRRGETFHGSPGLLGVCDWDAPSGAVIGNASVTSGNASAAVADPRIPEATEAGTWIIVALDGTWHRPLTTLELAVLQGLPTHLPTGQPLALAGNSQARWRERIGNAVPVPAAEAVATTMLRTLMGAKIGQWVWSIYCTAVWVRLGAKMRRSVP